MSLLCYAGAVALLFGRKLPQKHLLFKERACHLKIELPAGTKLLQNGSDIEYPLVVPVIILLRVSLLNKIYISIYSKAISKLPAKVPPIIDLYHLSCAGSLCGRQPDYRLEHLLTIN